MRKIWLTSIVALGLAVASGVARPAAAQSEEAAVEAAKAELKKYLAEKKLEGENALELFSVLVEAKVKPAKALELTKSAVEKDAKWDFLDVVEKVEEAMAAGKDEAAIVALVTEAIEKRGG